MGCIISHSEDDKSVSVPEKRKLKIVMIGLEQSGKTSLLYYLKNGQFTPTQPTVGLNVETIPYQNKLYLLFDVGGKVRSLWSHYYDSLDAIIFVVDASDKSKLYTVRDELVLLNQQLEFQNVVVLIYFSKWDAVTQPEIYQTLVEEAAIYKSVD